MPKITSLAIAALLVTAAPVWAQSEAEGLAQVKAFALEHNVSLVANSEQLHKVVSDYAGIIEAHGGDYAAAWAADSAKLAQTIKEIRSHWLAASNEYETIEGIVAGIPSLVKYDLILDAGNPGTEDEDIAPYDLTLPDGTVLERPGSLFHTITEPLFWGGDKAHVRAEVDFDGNGVSGPGEILFDANLALGGAEGLVTWSKALETDLRAWQANRDDAFTAVVTMTPTVGDYFGEWRESVFIGGDSSAFVAQSRLFDVIGIMSGCERMYTAAVSPVVVADDPALDASVTKDFAELLALVKETRAREEAGERFSVEEADALGSQAQDIAERIVAQVLQAAARNAVEIKG